MPNKQPFYHRVVVLFSAVRELTESEISTAVQVGFDKDTDVLKESIVIEEYDVDAGDPYDLMN